VSVGLDLSHGLALEAMQRMAIRILHAELDAELVMVAAEKAQEDADFYTEMGLEPQEITLEPVAKFHAGHRPSLIEAPLEDYPNVSTMAYNAVARAGSDDTAVWYDTRLAVEVMVKAIGGTLEERFSRENQAAEELVNVRIQRTADAAHRVMLRHRTLDGLVTQLGDTPTVNVGDVFERRANKGVGSRWLWQGARLDYVVPKYVELY
jgi:hypothetical protein